MADEPDEDIVCFDDFEVQLGLGTKVLQMVEKLLPMHAIAPGVRAEATFELDERKFKIMLEVAGD